MLIWALVAASAAVWGLRLGAQPRPVPPSAAVAVFAPPAGGDLSRLLGQAPPPAPVAAVVAPAESRFKLLGVVAPRGGQVGTGLALVAVDGKPARAVGVGHELEPGLRVLRVGHRDVELGAQRGAPAMTLSLPAMAEASRGRLGETMSGLAPQNPALPVVNAGTPVLAVPPGLRPPAFGMGGPVPAGLPPVQTGQVSGEPHAVPAEPPHAQQQR